MKYKVKYIKWWDCIWYKEGISFTGWVSVPNKGAIKSYMICIFNKGLSNVPEKGDAICVEKEINGSDLAVMTKRERNKYQKDAEKAMFELVKTSSNINQK